MSDRWMSVEEIANYLGVSKDTVYAWITTKKMPAHRVGRLWKFKSDEIDSWVRAGKASDEGSGRTLSDASGSGRHVSGGKNE